MKRFPVEQATIILAGIFGGLSFVIFAAWFCVEAQPMVRYLSENLR